MAIYEGSCALTKGRKTEWFAVLTWGEALDVCAPHAFPLAASTNSTIAPRRKARLRSAKYAVSSRVNPSEGGAVTESIPL